MDGSTETMKKKWNDVKFQFLEVQTKPFDCEGNKYSLLKDIVKAAMVTPVSNT